MKTMQVLTEGRIGVVPVTHIELAYVISERSLWKLELSLVSGQKVTSMSFGSRMEAEAAIRELFNQ